MLCFVWLPVLVDFGPLVPLRDAFRRLTHNYHDEIVCYVFTWLMHGSLSWWGGCVEGGVGLICWHSPHMYFLTYSWVWGVMCLVGPHLNTVFCWDISSSWGKLPLSEFNHRLEPKAWSQLIIPSAWTDGKGMFTASPRQDKNICTDLLEIMLSKLSFTMDRHAFLDPAPDFFRFANKCRV